MEPAPPYDRAAGVRRLLRHPPAFSIPGLAHLFTFWGFIILIFTIIEAYGDLFSRTFAIPGIGHSFALGFIEDLFAVLVLVGLVTFAIIRLRDNPEHQGRKSRFYGSHTGAAWLVPAGIFLVVATLLLYRGAQIDTGVFPYAHGAFASQEVGHWLRGRYVTGELAAAGITAHLAEQADTAFARGRKRHAKTGRTGSRHLRQLLAEGRLPECWIPPAQVLECRPVLEAYHMSAIAMQVALDAVRNHGYSTEFDVERHFRDTPLMIVGEGANEIQRNVITAQLVKRGRLARR